MHVKLLLFNPHEPERGFSCSAASDDDCDLPRVHSTAGVLDPRPGVTVAPMTRCAAPTQHGFAVYGALRLFQRGPDAQA